MLEKDRLWGKTNKYLSDPQNFSGNILWTDETNVKLFEPGVWPKTALNDLTLIYIIVNFALEAKAA